MRRNAVSRSRRLPSNEKRSGTRIPHRDLARLSKTAAGFDRTSLDRTLIYLALAIAVIATGLLLRLLPLGLPFFLVKYGGSVLWAVMVYLLFAALQPRRRPFVLALIACAFAGLVEVFRLYHSPQLDAFRLTLAGALLLGRVFSAWHLLAYWAAILCSAALDGLARRRAR